MANLVLALVCFGLGALGRRSGRLPAETPKVLVTWVFFVSLPAMVLSQVHQATFGLELVLASAGLWLIFIIAAGLALLAVRQRWLTPQVAGALALTAGLSNTSFVGLPLLEALGGSSTLAPAVVMDQLGSFLLLPTLAMPLAVHLSKGTPQKARGSTLRRVLAFPPFIALVLAVVLRPVPFAPGVNSVLTRLGDMLSPLALASVGWQLDVRAVKGNLRRLGVGLGYKLVLAPLVVWLLSLMVTREPGLVVRIAVAQAAMGPMVTGGALAMEHELEPALASTMVALGILGSLITVPLWWFWLG